MTESVLPCRAGVVGMGRVSKSHPSGNIDGISDA